MKSWILNILQTQKGPVSGEAMGKAFGCSRVAVHNQIRELRKMGYPIQAGPGGYSMEKDPDLLYPFGFPENEKRMQHFEETDSTMDAARKAAQNGAPHLFVVTCDRQIRGRGRLDRKWDSHAGGLYFTMILRPDTSPQDAYLFNFCASVTLARVLRTLYGIDARLKWPNDILAEGKKITGILSEMACDADRIHYLLIGIGVNVNNHLNTFSREGTSVSQITGKPGSRKAILSLFLDEYEDLIGKEGWKDIVSAWKTLSTTLGKEVVVQTHKETIEGLALDVDETAALLVQEKTGRIRKITYGDCFIRH